MTNENTSSVGTNSEQLAKGVSGWGVLGGLALGAFGGDFTDRLWGDHWSSADHHLWGAQHWAGRLFIGWLLYLAA